MTTGVEVDAPIATDLYRKAAARRKEKLLTRCDAKSCLKPGMFEEEPRCHAKGELVGMSHFCTFRGVVLSVEETSIKKMSTFISLSKRVLDALT